jgi:hypothetical protein
VTLGSKSRRTHDHILLSHLRLPQLGRPAPRIYIPQEQGGPVIPPDNGFPFVASYDSLGYGGGMALRLAYINLDGPTRSRFSVVFLGPRTNSELVPKFHVALHASHAAVPMVALKISPCTNVTLILTLTLGCITLFMGDMSEGALHQEDEVTFKQRKSGYGPIWGPGNKTNWPTDRRSQCNLKLNLRHCTANYRPVLASERAPYMKSKESNCHSNKCNIWPSAPKGARHQDELAD